MSLRLLWVSHFLPYPPSGGVLQRGFGLVRHLGRACELHLLAMHQPRLFRQTGGADAADLTAAVAKIQAFCSSVQLLPIPAETRPVGRPLAAMLAAARGRSYTEQWLASAAMARAVEQASARIRPDVVHLDTISLAPYARHCPEDARISLGHHNVESHMMWRRARNARSTAAACLLRVEAARILALEREHAPKADVNVVCSALDGRRLSRLAGPCSVHVAENGVLEPEVSSEVLGDASRFAATQARLLFIGRMSAYTNRGAAEFLVRDLWPAIAQSRPEMSLDIVGSGAPKVALEAAAADPRVRVHGFVKDLSTVVAPGCIFVCPVRDGGGTKLKILDAMNRGLPIVAHPTAVEGIDVQQGRHVLLARTPAEFVEAIVELSSPERRLLLARNAYELVRERYAFERIAQGLLERFQQVAAPEGGERLAGATGW